MKLGCKSTSTSRECADFLGSQISRLDAVPSRMICTGSVCPSSTSACFWSSISHLGLSSESFRLPRVCSAEAQRANSVQSLLHPHKLAQRQWFYTLEYKSSPSLLWRRQTPRNNEHIWAPLGIRCEQKHGLKSGPCSASATSLAHFPHSVTGFFWKGFPSKSLVHELLCQELFLVNPTKDNLFFLFRCRVFC